MTDNARPAWKLEEEPRALNATDWEPLPGMVEAAHGPGRSLFGLRAAHRKTRRVAIEERQ